MFSYLVLDCRLFAVFHFIFSLYDGPRVHAPSNKKPRWGVVHELNCTPSAVV